MGASGGTLELRGDAPAGLEWLEAADATTTTARFGGRWPRVAAHRSFFLAVVWTGLLPFWIGPLSKVHSWPDVELVPAVGTPIYLVAHTLIAGLLFRAAFARLVNRGELSIGEERLTFSIRPLSRERPWTELLRDIERVAVASGGDGDEEPRWHVDFVLLDGRVARLPWPLAVEAHARFAAARIAALLDQRKARLTYRA